MSFFRDVKKFTTEVEEGNERIIKGTAIALYGDIIRSSPVDSGRFRANWFLSGKRPSRKKTKKEDRSGQEKINEVTNSILKSRKFRIFTLTNNLPYAEVIELGGYKKENIRSTESKVTHSGFSKQAPKGVVRVNTLRFNALLEEQARKEGYGRI